MTNGRPQKSFKKAALLKSTVFASLWKGWKHKFITSDACVAWPEIAGLLSKMAEQKVVVGATKQLEEKSENEGLSRYFGFPSVGKCIAYSVILNLCSIYV